jgi:hypothetical protein
LTQASSCHGTARISQFGLSFDPADVVHLFPECIPKIRLRRIAYRVLVFRQDCLEELMEFVNVDDDAFSVSGVRDKRPATAPLNPGIAFGF